MRKHLAGGKIKSVTQYDFERVINIEVEAYNELGDIVIKHIIAEIMGKHSNIIFTDDNMRIIDSIKHIDITMSRVRNILPGLTYSYPPAQDKANPFLPSNDGFGKVLTGALSVTDITVNRAILSNLLGFSPLLAREISFIATGNTDTVLSGENISTVSAALTDFISKINSGKFMPCVLYEQTKPFDFSAVNPQQYGNLVKSVTFSSISKALDDFYVTRDRLERMRQKGAALKKTVQNNIDRLHKKLKIQEETIRDAKNKEKYKIYGELLTTNMYRIKYGDSEATVQNYYEPDCPVVTIKLDVAKSPSQNAQNYFKRYRKLKTAEQMSIEQKAATLTELEYMESVLLSVEKAETVAELDQIKEELYQGGYLHKQKTGKKNRVSKQAQFNLKKYILPGGYELFVGKNNQQNDYLTLKVARSRDMWFHVKNSPGSHVVLKYNNEPFTNQAIEIEARIAAYFSSINHGAQVEVDYTEIKNVKKPSGAKPGMVIYEHYQTAFVTPIAPDEFSNSHI